MGLTSAPDDAELAESSGENGWNDACRGKLTIVLQKRLLEDVDSALTGKDFTAVCFGYLDELSVTYKVYIY